MTFLKDVLTGVLGLRESGEEEEEAAEVGGRDLTLTTQGIFAEARYKSSQALSWLRFLLRSW